MNSKIFEKHEANLIGLLEAVNEKISQEKFNLALCQLKDCEEIIEEPEEPAKEAKSSGSSGGIKIWIIILVVVLGGI